MSEVQMCAVLVGVGGMITVIQMLILWCCFKLYTEFFKERVKGK